MKLLILKGTILGLWFFSLILFLLDYVWPGSVFGIAVLLMLNVLICFRMGMARYGLEYYGYALFTAFILVIFLVYAALFYPIPTGWVIGLPLVVLVVAWVLVRWWKEIRDSKAQTTSENVGQEIGKRKRKTRIQL